MLSVARQLRSEFVVGAVAICLLATSVATAQSTLPLSLVIKNTDPVPGFAGEIWTPTTSAFQNPTIDLSNNVAFSADINNSGNISTANDVGYWYGSAGTVANIIQEGGPLLPGTTGDTFVSRQTNNVSISPNGNMWIGGSIAGQNITANNDQAIWAGQFGSFQKLYQEGDAVPGLINDANLADDDFIQGPASSSSSGNRINNAGQTVLSGTVINGPPTGENGGVWVASPGNLGLVYQRGVANAAFPGGEIITSGGSQGLNGSGTLQLSLGLAIGQAGVTTADSAVLMNGDGTGALSLIGRSNMATGIAGINYGETVQVNPFFPPQVPFFGVRQSINNGGRNLFGARIAGAGITQGVNDSALMTNATGSSSILKQSGDAAPSIAGATLSGINFNESSINNNDQYAWLGNLAGAVTTADDSAIYISEVGGGDSLVVREGDAVPGLADTFFGSLSSVLLNNMGQLVFTSTLTGNAVTSSDDRSIWMWDPNDGLFLVIREGATPFGINTAGSFTFGYDTSANGEGGSQAFNDLGCLAFRIGETSGNGNELGILTTCIPEPTAGLLVLLASGMALVRRRR